MSNSKVIESDSSFSTPILSGPKRQHFLPRFYLEGFTNNGKLAVYDRETNRVRVQQPINTGVIGHFYTLEDAEGRKRYELEQMLSEYEANASPTVCKLSAKQEISPDERAYLSIFVALAAFRTPDIVDSLKLMNSDLIGEMTRRMFSDKEQVKDGLRVKPYAPSSEEELEQEAIEMIEFAQGGQYTITTEHSWAVGMAIQTGLKIAPILAGRNWDVIHSNTDKTSFVTTDAPVVLSTVIPRKNSFWGLGFGNTDALVVFPLTQTCALLMYGNDGDFRHRSVDRDHVRHCNTALADRCQRFVIGRDEALVRSLADFLHLPSKKWSPKMQRS